MPKVKVGDVNIYYEVHGEGEPFALIMGFGGSVEGWFRAIPVFSREYQLIAFDNRGAGRSDKPDVPYTMEMMADDLAGLLDAIGINSAHIQGISMGGMIAQHFALRYPERVTSLTLGCTTCGGPHSAMIDAETTSFMQSLPKLPPEEGTRELLRLCMSQEFIDKNPDLIEQIVAKMLEHPAPPHGMMRQLQAIMGHDTYEHLPEIKAPTMVIAGDADRLIPVENSRILASKIPGAELVILKNMGHMFGFEAEDETNRIMLDFLRRHRRAS